MLEFSGECCMVVVNAGMLKGMLNDSSECWRVVGNTNVSSEYWHVVGNAEW